jgi:hypothetical protein
MTTVPALMIDLNSTTEWEKRMADCSHTATAAGPDRLEGTKPVEAGAVVISVHLLVEALVLHSGVSAKRTAVPVRKRTALVVQESSLLLHPWSRSAQSMKCSCSRPETQSPGTREAWRYPRRWIWGWGLASTVQPERVCVVCGVPEEYLDGRSPASRLVFA